MRDRRASPVGRRSPGSLPIVPSRSCSSMGKCSTGSQRKSHTRATAESIAWLRPIQTLAHVIAAIAPLMCQAAALTVFESTARAANCGAFGRGRSVR